MVEALIDNERQALRAGVFCLIDGAARVSRMPYA